MALPDILKDKLRLPAVGAPLFIISHPALVIAQCKAGIVGAFPALNARPISQLDEWLHEITEPSPPMTGRIRSGPPRHSRSTRLSTSPTLGSRRTLRYGQVEGADRHHFARRARGREQAVHAYGGLTLHDIINNRFAHKAIEKGADGLIAVAAGAGGHAGSVSPFALIQDIRA